MRWIGFVSTLADLKAIYISCSINVISHMRYEEIVKPVTKYHAS